MPMVALAFLRVRRQGRLSGCRRSGGARDERPPEKRKVDRSSIGSPYLTGVPPIRSLRSACPEPACRPYGALAVTPLPATGRDRRRRGSFLAFRAVRVVAMRTRRAWFFGLANPRAFLATSLAVRLCASAFAFDRVVNYT